MKKFIAGLLIGATLMSGAVYATGAKLEVSLQSLKFFINGTSTQQSAFIHEGTTYVPVRFVSEKLGKEVVWDGKTQSITIGEKGETATPVTPVVKGVSYEDGTYRGFFADRGDIQVAVEFKLENNKVASISFRQLYYGNKDYRTEKEDQLIVGLKGQHEQLINYLVGKDITVSLSDLYKPENIVKENVDTFTGATLRSGKVISAVRDALNRGVYKY